ncbi:MAG: tetratricopeptide repeat protein [Gemmatimonadaceae bacterium]
MLKLADLALRGDFSLGPLRVSPALRLVKGPAGEIHVEPLTMQVFLVLADAKGQVVTRNHLYDECWGGVHVGDYSLNRVITMVRRIAVAAGRDAFTIESIPRTGYRLLVNGEQGKRASAIFRWRIPAFIGAAALIALATLVWFVLDRKPHEASAAVIAMDSRSVELATRISSAAITAAATYQAPLHLLEDGDAQADFVLRIREPKVEDGRKVELVLLSKADRSLVWTWASTQPVETASSFDEAAREVGSQALACAAETRVRDPTPDQETVRLYVDACTKFGPWFSAELELLADAFEKVTARAPQMRGAWSKLFLSKAEAIEGFPPVDLVDSLKKDLSNARSRGIEVPETYIAKAAVLPMNARFERLRIYEAGIARYPSNLFLLSARSWQLRSLGRMDEAASTAQKLAYLYPESSAASTEFANSLMSSGRIDSARRVLQKASARTPGAPNLQSARWRLEMRYGDPKVALNIARSSDRVLGPAMVSFVEARINPTKANIDRAIAMFEAQYRAEPRDPTVLAQALGAFGRNEEAIRLLLRYDGSNSGDGAEVLFRPPLHDVLRDPRFMKIAENFGITDYWIKSGILPDFCYEPDLPYDCKRQLAEIRD